jgi:hypothetical protein
VGLVREATNREGSPPALIRAVLSTALVAFQLTTLGVASPAHAGGSVSKRYPGNAPCDTTLRRCIKRVPAGSTIRIAKNNPIEEDFTIRKDLTLKNAKGFNPVLALTDQLLTVEKIQGRGSLDVTISGITFDDTGIEWDVESGKRHSFELRNSTVQGQQGVDLSFAKPGSAVIRNNTIETTAYLIEVDSQAPNGLVTVDIGRNTITSPLRDNGNSGIEVDAEGRTLANLNNNVIYQVAGCNCGGAAGIDFTTSGDGEGEVNIVHNTLDDIVSDSAGIQLRNDAPTTSSLTANIFNNIVTRAGDSGIELPNFSASTTIANGYNDFYDNGDPPDYGGYSAGPNTVSVDPLYVNTGGRNYRLSVGSPVRSVGLPCSPAGLTRTDIDGGLRVDNYFTSLGAYEITTAPAPAGVTLVGTDGPDSLTGGNGRDVLCGMDEVDILLGLGNNDVIFGGGGADEVRGGAGDDFVLGEAGQDLVYGGTGDDEMYGGADFDEIFGQDGVKGNDYLDGGDGVDSCNPDPGDTFNSC